MVYLFANLFVAYALIASPTTERFRVFATLPAREAGLFVRVEPRKPER